MISLHALNLWLVIGDRLKISSLPTTSPHRFVVSFADLIMKTSTICSLLVPSHNKFGTYYVVMLTVHLMFLLCIFIFNSKLSKI